MAEIQVGFRVDEKLHSLAMVKSKASGGISGVIREGFQDFLSGDRNFEPDKYTGSLAKANKDKRINIKLNEDIYEQIQRKSVKFGGVSGLVRVILKAYCSS